MQLVHGFVVQATIFTVPRVNRLLRLISACSMYLRRASRSTQNSGGALNPGARPLYAVPITRLSKSMATAPTFRNGSSERRLATCASAMAYCGIVSRACTGAALVGGEGE